MMRKKILSNSGELQSNSVLISAARNSVSRILDSKVLGYDSFVEEVTPQGFCVAGSAVCILDKDAIPLNIAKHRSKLMMLQVTHTLEVILGQDIFKQDISSVPYFNQAVLGKLYDKRGVHSSILRLDDGEALNERLCEKLLNYFIDNNARLSTKHGFCLFIFSKPDSAGVQQMHSIVVDDVSKLGVIQLYEVGTKETICSFTHKNGSVVSIGLLFSQYLDAIKTRIFDDLAATEFQALYFKSI